MGGEQIYRLETDFSIFMPAPTGARFFVCLLALFFNSQIWEKDPLTQFQMSISLIEKWLHNSVSKFSLVVKITNTS